MKYFFSLWTIAWAVISPERQQVHVHQQVGRVNGIGIEYEIGIGYVCVYRVVMGRSACACLAVARTVSIW